MGEWKHYLLLFPDGYKAVRQGKGWKLQLQHYSGSQFDFSDKSNAYFRMKIGLWLSRIVHFHLQELWPSSFIRVKQVPTEWEDSVSFAIQAQLIPECHLTSVFVFGIFPSLSISPIPPLGFPFLLSSSKIPCLLIDVQWITLLWIKSIFQEDCE